MRMLTFENPSFVRLILLIAGSMKIDKHFLDSRFNIKRLLNLHYITMIHSHTKKKFWVLRSDHVYNMFLGTLSGQRFTITPENPII